MTKDLLEVQRKALESEKQRLESAAKEGTGNTEADRKALDAVHEEYDRRTRQLAEVRDAQRARQKAFIERKKEERRAKKLKNHKEPDKQ